jgi:hypothetical protein
MATIVPDMKNRRLFFLVVLLLAAFVPALPTSAQMLLRVATPGALTDSYKMMRADARADLFPTEESIVNVLRTMSYEDPAFLSTPPYKFVDLSLIQELKAESH